ncbi:MAG: hypothetical protein ABIF40_03235 [archaeon]
MKSIVFDAGTIISLTTNNLLWILEPLKTKYKGEFYIPLSVKRELIDKPFKTKRFKLEALQVLSIINRGVLTIYDDNLLKVEKAQIANLANNMYLTKKRPLTVVHEGEVAAVATALHLKSDALAIDERTMRVLIEDPTLLTKLYKHKLHMNIKIDKKNLKALVDLVHKIKVIRSTEVTMVAYELGLLDNWMKKNGQIERNLTKELLDGFLWGLKIRGCSISKEEIAELLKFKGFKL